MLTAVTCSTLGLTDGAACCCVSACGRTAARVWPNPRGARACRFPGCTPRATSLYQYVGNFVRSYSPPAPHSLLTRVREFTCTVTVPHDPVPVSRTLARPPHDTIEQPTASVLRCKSQNLSLLRMLHILTSPLPSLSHSALWSGQ